MSDTMNLNVRISGSLKDFVSHEVTEGDYENASEFIRDMIRERKRAKQEAAFQQLKAHLQQAAAQPRSAYVESSADKIRERAKKRLASR